jgi:long-chain fatty acid transport protein
MGKKTIVLFVSLFIVSSSCYLDGSGFRPYELSARAAALGGAFAALTDDATAVYYNPAGLAFSTGIMLRTNICYPKMTVTADNPAFPTPYKSSLGKIRASHFVSASIKERIGVGIGVFTPNSMETYWPENWMGRDLSIHSKLNTLYVRPVVSVKIAKFISIGAGLDFISSDVTWKYEKVLTFQEMGSGDVLLTTSESKLSAKGIGYVAGTMLRINDKIRIGGRYQPKVKLDFTGSHSFIFTYMPYRIFGNTRGVISSLTLPQEYVLGIMYSPWKHLTFQMDYQSTGMSEIKQWEFDLDPECYDAIENYYGTRPDEIRHGFDLDLIDISRIMLGAEYRLKDFIVIRAGYTYLKSAVNGQMIHPVFPDLGTNILSFGFGYDGPAFSIWDYEESIGGISLDVFFQYGFSPNSVSALPEFPATYRASRWNVGLGLGFTFGSL